MTEFRIAVPIVGPTVTAAQDQIRAALHYSPSLFEVRIDMFGHDTSGIEVVKELARDGRTVIATCRHRSETGLPANVRPSFTVTNAERGRILQDAYAEGATFADWEYS